jgi:hypothetical protein
MTSIEQKNKRLEYYEEKTILRSMVINHIQSNYHIYANYDDFVNNTAKQFNITYSDVMAIIMGNYYLIDVPKLSRYFKAKKLLEL